MKKLTHQQFLKKCEAVWSGKYDLSKVVYTGMKNKINVVCMVHGEFQVTATNFTGNKSGCPICGAQNAKSTEIFIAQCKEKHGDKYEYNETIYKNARTKVKIKCPEHGHFEQLPNVHVIKGSGCPKCSNVSRHTVNEFIEKAKKIHAGKYDYSKTIYKRAIDPVVITCKKHGDFEQLPHNHLSAKGCPECGKETFLDKMRMSFSDAVSLCEKSGTELLYYAGDATKKSKIRCSKNHVWFTSLCKIQQGSNCPVCSIPGYNPAKRGYVYLLVSHDGKYMKIGLSNSPKKRIRTLKATTPFDFVVRGWTCYEGSLAPKIETLFHKKCVVAGLKGFDGCSEWFNYDEKICNTFDEEGLP